MKKWLRRTLIAAALIGVGLAILYEYGTHVGRGWLYDEAFFQGRPTSYWRSAINAWVERFDTPRDAEEYMRMTLGRGWASPNFPLRPPRPTVWTSACRSIGLAADDAGDMPAVLGSFPEALPVWRELEDDPALRPFVERARSHAVLVRLPRG